VNEITPFCCVLDECGEMIPTKLDLAIEEFIQIADVYILKKNVPTI